MTANHIQISPRLALHHSTQVHMRSPVGLLRPGMIRLAFGILQMISKIQPGMRQKLGPNLKKTVTGNTAKKTTGKSADDIGLATETQLGLFELKFCKR